MCPLFPSRLVGALSPVGLQASQWLCCQWFVLLQSGLASPKLVLMLSAAGGSCVVSVIVLCVHTFHVDLWHPSKLRGVPSALFSLTLP